jgi:hypothetical protein
MSVDRLMEERIARNDAAFREANEDIEASAIAYGVDIPVPFVCECADPSCREFVRLRLDEYEEVRADPRHFLNVPGHQVAAQGAADVVAERGGYVIVRKKGHAGEVAEALDERTGGDAERRKAAEQ